MRVPSPSRLSPLPLLRTYSPSHSRPTTPISFERGVRLGGEADPDAAASAAEREGEESERQERLARTMASETVFWQSRLETTSMPQYRTYSAESSSIQRSPLGDACNVSGPARPPSVVEQHQQYLRSRQGLSSFYEFAGSARFPSPPVTPSVHDTISPQWTTSMEEPSAPHQLSLESISSLTAPPTHQSTPFPTNSTDPRLYHIENDHLVGLGISLPNLDRMLPYPGSFPSVLPWSQPRPPLPTPILPPVPQPQPSHRSDEHEASSSKRRRFNDVPRLVASPASPSTSSSTTSPVSPKRPSTAPRNSKTSSLISPSTHRLPSFTPPVGSALRDLCDELRIPLPSQSSTLVVVWDGTFSRALPFDASTAAHLVAHASNDILLFPAGQYERVKDKKGTEVFPWSSGTGSNDWVRHQAEMCHCQKFKFHQGKDRYRKHPSVIRDHVMSCSSRQSEDPFARLCRLERRAEK